MQETKTEVETESTSPVAKRRKVQETPEEKEGTAVPSLVADPLDAAEWSEVEALLQSIRLKKYAAKLKDEGFDSLERLVGASVEDLALSSGVGMKRGHAIQLLNLAKSKQENNKDKDKDKDKDNIEEEDDSDWPVNKLQKPSSNKGKQVVLVAPGSYSPITNMHLRMFEEARDYLAGRSDGWDVMGGFISPVHDGYGKTNLLASTHREAMCRLAVKSSSWINVAPWELRQDGWSRTLQTLQASRAALDDLPGLGKAPAVKLLCGADLLQSMGDKAIWSLEDVNELFYDFGVVVIPRPGLDLEKVIASTPLLQKYASSIEVVTQRVMNSVSSTEVRAHLAANDSVKYLIPDAVIQYIFEHKLFGHSMPRSETAGKLFENGFVRSVSSPSSVVGSSRSQPSEANRGFSSNLPYGDTRGRRRPSGRAQNASNNNTTSERRLGLWSGGGSGGGSGKRLGLGGGPAPDFSFLKTASTPMSPQLPPRHAKVLTSGAPTQPADFSFLKSAQASTPLMKSKGLDGPVMDSPRLPSSQLPANSHLGSDDFLNSQSRKISPASPMLMSCVMSQWTDSPVLVARPLQSRRSFTDGQDFSFLNNVSASPRLDLRDFPSDKTESGPASENAEPTNTELLTQSISETEVRPPERGSLVPAGGSFSIKTKRLPNIPREVDSGDGEKTPPLISRTLASSHG